MKYLLSIVCLIFLHISFSQNWAWVDHLTGGGGSHYTIDCTIGNDSNSYYFCGRYRATATFYGQDGTDIINPPFGGSRDIFLAKTDSAGQLLWVKTIGGSDTEYGFSVTVDENDNVYLTGQFYTGCNFEGTPIVSVGSGDVYVAKFDSNGNFIWVKTFGGVGLDTGTKLTCDRSGFLYLVGTQGGNFNYNASTLVDPGYFVSKLDYNGNIIWAKGPDNITAALSNLYGIKYFKDALYVAGKYNGTMMIDAISLVSNGGWSDLFFAKLDTSGVAQWAYDAGSTTYDLCNDIAVSDSFIFITGAYSGTISFDTITRTSDQSVAGSTGALNSRDAYIARYDSTGACHWVIEHKSLLADQGNSIYIDKNGDVLVAGNYLHSPDPTVVGSVGELRVSSYKQNGEFNWTISSVGVNTGEGLAICPDYFGNVLLSGAVKNTHTFGDYTIPASSAVYSGVMAKILPPLNPITDQSSQACLIDTAYYLIDVNGGPITYDWYYGSQNLISNLGDSLILLFDPLISDSISCVVSNGMETDTLVFNSPTFNFPIVDLGNDYQTCETSVELNAGSGGLYYDWGTGQILYDSLLLISASNTYFVTVTNADDCETRDTIEVTFVDCTGINSNENSGAVYSAFFNEALNAFVILSSGVNYDLVIFDSSGRQVINKMNVIKNQTIAAEYFESGLYIIIITDGESKKTTALKCIKI